MNNDSLYLIRLSKEMFVAGRDRVDATGLALNYADNEEYKVDSIQQITAVEDVPESWLESYPYSRDSLDALKTCGEYLNPPSEVEKPPTVRDVHTRISDFLERYYGCVFEGKNREEIVEEISKIINPE